MVHMVHVDSPISWSTFLLFQIDLHSFPAKFAKILTSYQANDCYKKCMINNNIQFSLNNLQFYHAICSMETGCFQEIRPLRKVGSFKYQSNEEFFLNSVFSHDDTCSPLSHQMDGWHQLIWVLKCLNSKVALYHTALNYSAVRAQKLSLNITANNSF